VKKGVGVAVTVGVGEGGSAVGVNKLGVTGASVGVVEGLGVRVGGLGTAVAVGITAVGSAQAINKSKTKMVSEFRR
jgi:hypothetical protein